MRLKPDYDYIAPFYDRLSRLIFGNSLLQAQLFLIRSIPAASTVLIVGGGTGWILEAITNIHPSGLKMTYIDASEKMMTVARKRHTGYNTITYITAPAEEATLAGEFDVIVTPFFFDNFKEDNAKRIFSTLERSLSKNGLWLYCDFTETKIIRQRLLLRSMYIFFRIFCRIEARKLPTMTTHFQGKGYTIMEQQTFMGKFVLAASYKRLVAE